METTLVGVVVAALIWALKFAFTEMRGVTKRFMDHAEASNATHQATAAQLGKIADRLDEVARYQKSNHQECMGAWDERVTPTHQGAAAGSKKPRARVPPAKEKKG